MMARPEACRTGNGAYSAAVLSTQAEIQDLKASLSLFGRQDDILRDPAFFLASVATKWEPKVVAVRGGGELLGVVCAKEMLVPGFRFGLAYADLTFGSILLGDPQAHPDTIVFALKTLLASPGVGGLRLRVQRRSAEMAAVRKMLAAGGLDVRFSRVKDHAILALPCTYEQLLQSFGSTTRHNFRYYRRRFEAAGHVYLEDLSLNQVRLAAADLESKSSIPVRPGSTGRMIAMAATAERPLAVGLRHRNGEWLSIVCGVYRPAAGVLILQLNNDRDFPKDSLSVVMRAYLIESLIRQGMKELVIWSGTAAPLSRYATYIPTAGIYLDRPTWGWRFLRGLASRVGPLLPKDIRQDVRWISPFS